MPDKRIVLPDMELNRVLGGGIIPGSLILLGGEPGIGKSTLMLQLALSVPSLKVLYITGEESMSQVKMRAERMPVKSDRTLIFTETDTSAIFNQIGEIAPDLVVVDSVQTLSSPLAEGIQGSVSQIRQCTTEWMKWAKQTNVPVFLVGHITKDGNLAGPKILEHMVDTVLQFEGERTHNYRLLRTLKNRFGSTSELGMYEMRNTGLVEVNNPSEILLSSRNTEVSGMAVGSTIEGNRVLMVEVQSLVSTAAYGTPQRQATGFDTRRLHMMLAVLEKRAGFRILAQDVFLNMAGGLRIEDPAIDLPVCAALLSSLNDIPLSYHVCYIGEVGLGGEIRPVSKIELRIAEAEKLGFSTVYLSANHKKAFQNKSPKIALKFIDNISELSF